MLTTVEILVGLVRGKQEIAQTVNWANSRANYLSNQYLLLKVITQGK
jgi:hypothetical protein